MSTPKIIEVSIGKKGLALVNQHKSLLKVDQQPAGLNFHDMDWPGLPKGTVNFRHTSSDTIIRHVMSLTAVEDAEDPDAGIFELRLNTRVTENDLVPHEEARLTFSAILKELMSKGWKPVIPRNMPRLVGKDALRYILETGSPTTPDPSDIPSLQEWMQLKDLTTWKFYFDRVFLEVSFMRHDSLLDPLRPGAYLFTFKFLNEVKHFQNYMLGKDRKIWRELLPATLTQKEVSRAEAEAALKSRGIKINEGYQDPPLPRLD